MQWTQGNLKGSPNQHKGMLMKHIVASRLTPPTPGGINETTVPQSMKESQHNQALQAYWNARNFMGNVITRVVLPHDGKSLQEVERAQAARQAEWQRQSAMPWGNSFMHTPTDAQRLNNPAQSSFTKQRQLTIPSSYGQFYSFMHALSAAFGNLNQ